MRFLCFQVRKCHLKYISLNLTSHVCHGKLESRRILSDKMFRVHVLQTGNNQFPKHHFQGQMCTVVLRSMVFLQTYSGSAMYRQIVGEVYSQLGQNFKTTNPINHQTPVKIRLVQLLHGKFHHSLNVPVSKIN